jgi:beta-ureidopropionase
MCFQELFYGPYFCQVQEAEYYDYTELIPDGPTTQRFCSVAKELGMVMVLPMYEVEQDGLYYNTAAVIDADGTYLGKYRKQHIPQVKGFWEKFYFRPGQRRVPDLRDRGRQGRRLHLLRPALPGGLAHPRPQRRPDRVQPVGHPRGACRSTCGSSSSRRPLWPTCTTWGRSTGSASSRSATTTSTARATSSTRGPVRRRRGRPVQARADRARPRHRHDPEVRDGWQFYRDRRPDAYDELVARETAELRGRHGSHAHQERHGRLADRPHRRTC